MIVHGGMRRLILAIVVGAIVCGLVALAVSRRLWPPASAMAAMSIDGYQEMVVTVKGRYRPHTIRVVQNVPVRLRFLRLEDAPCSERVVFASYAIDRRLPPFQESVVEFVPSETGSFLFTCEWGMYRGTLVVAPQKEARSIEARTLPGRAAAPSAPWPGVSAFHAGDEGEERSEGQ